MSKVHSKVISSSVGGRRLETEEVHYELSGASNPTAKTPVENILLPGSP